MDLEMEDVELEREDRFVPERQKKETKKSSYSLLSNMLVAFLITFAAAVECADNSLPENLQTAFTNITVIVCVLTWIGISFVSGWRKKWGFAVFSTLLWILPQIIILLATKGPKAFRFSLTMYLLSEFSNVFSSELLNKLFSWITANTVVSSLIMAAVCGVCWAGGFFTKKLQKRH